MLFLSEFVFHLNFNFSVFKMLHFYQPIVHPRSTKPKLITHSYPFVARSLLATLGDLPASLRVH